jgi:hypothetical protein
LVRRIRLRLTSQIEHEDPNPSEQEQDAKHASEHLASSDTLAEVLVPLDAKIASDVDDGYMACCCEEAEDDGLTGEPGMRKK